MRIPKNWKEIRKELDERTRWTEQDWKNYLELLEEDEKNEEH